MEPSLSAIVSFLDANGKTTSDFGERNSQRATSIDGHGMTLTNELYIANTANKALEQQYIFRWDQVGNGEIVKRSHCENLIVELKPDGVLRMLEPSEGFWRKGRTPNVIFVFGTRSQTVAFYDLLLKAALGHGAKIAALPLKESSEVIVENRKKTARHGEASKKAKELMDKIYPREP